MPLGGSSLCPMLDEYISGSASVPCRWSREFSLFSPGSGISGNFLFARPTCVETTMPPFESHVTIGSGPGPPAELPVRRPPREGCAAASEGERQAEAITARLERKRRSAKDSGCPTAGTVQIAYALQGLWSCVADPGEMTVLQAHKAMQLHLECGVDTCWVRRRARAALVEDGRMVLDDRATHVE